MGLMYKEINELVDMGIDIEALKDKNTHLLDIHDVCWGYSQNYTDPFGVDILVLKSFVTA
jgi:hypothetical protein